MRSRWRCLVGVLVVSAAGAAPPAGKEPVTLATPQPAFVLADQSVVPLRPLLDWLGAGSTWKDIERALYVLRVQGGKRTVLRLVQGSREATVDGNKLTLPMAPFTARGALYVPLKPLLGALAITARWTDKPHGIALTDGARRAFLPLLAPRYALVARDGALIGGRSRQAWVGRDALAVQLAGGEPYWFYNLTQGVEAPVVGGKPETPAAEATPTTPAPAPTAAGPTVKLPWPEAANSGWVAFAGPWNVMPRQPRPLDPKTTGFEADMRKALVGTGLDPAAARIQQAVRVDLDNDEREDVLLVATTWEAGKPPAEGKPTDGACLLLRHKVGRETLTAPVFSHACATPGNPHPVDISVLATLDLDADGMLEVICALRAGKDTTLEVWHCAKGPAKRVLPVAPR